MSDLRHWAGSGSAASDWIFAAIRYVVGFAGIGGVLLALFLKYKDPQRYSGLGRTVLVEAHERWRRIAGTSAERGR